MIQKRIGVFETNSSSTHTLCIVPADVYEKLCSGEMFIGKYNDEPYTREEAISKAVEWHRKYGTVFAAREEVSKMGESQFIDFLRDAYIVRFEDWGNDDLEFFSESYKTPSGDEIVVFGEYGYEG